MCKSIAVFDFDKTLTRCDSFLPFLFYFNGFWKTTYSLLLLTPDFIRYLFGRLSRQNIKEKIIERFIAGRQYRDIQSLGEAYAEKKLDKYLRTEAMRRLSWHQSQGHRCILVSASFEFYLSPWARRHGFEEVLASRLELTPSGYVTGNLLGLNCWGPEKKNRLTDYLEHTLGAKDQDLYVYGDSRGDQEILAMADYPFYRRFK